jgi:predicted metal-dependent phosphoesterase TrpH
VREGYADLHVHTAYSDGVHSPSEVVRMASEAGLAWVSVTDHDSVAGLPEAAEEAARVGIGFVPGLELSVTHANRELHVLAYWIDTTNAGLETLLATVTRAREARVRTILDRLHALGVPLTRDRLARSAGARCAIGRPHVAQVLREDGWVGSVAEAFSRYLRVGGPAYVAKSTPDLRSCLGVLQGAGGVTVLAHPGVFPLGPAWKDLLLAGIQGLEAAHPAHRPAQADGFRRLAQRHALAATGGSDFHGRGVSESLVGSTRVDACVVEDLAARRKGHR